MKTLKTSSGIQSYLWKMLSLENRGTKREAEIFIIDPFDYTKSLIYGTADNVGIQ